MDNRIILLSSSCKITQGKYRSVIIDFDRDKLYYIQNQFAEILKANEGHSVCQIESELDDSESIKNFHVFLDFLLKNEIVFLAYSASCYPRRNEQIKETPSILDNLIIEVDKHYWNVEYEKCVMRSIADCNVADIQLRLFNGLDNDRISHILKGVEKSGAKYIELICSYKHIPKIDYAIDLLKNIPLLSKIIVFENEKNMHLQITNECSSATLTFGEIYLSTQTYCPNEMCGIINKHTLDFSGVDAYNLHHKYNGCLYKKAAISSSGEIKNCPSFSKSWGNIKSQRLCEIAAMPLFQELWNIDKDKISVCKDCELRYCCSDCRAHRINHMDLYSKPAKCFYNIKSGKWQE